MFWSVSAAATDSKPENASNNDTLRLSYMRRLYFFCRIIHHFFLTSTILVMWVFGLLFDGIVRTDIKDCLVVAFCIMSIILLELFYRTENIAKKKIFQLLCMISTLTSTSTIIYILSNNFYFSFFHLFFIVVAMSNLILLFFICNKNYNHYC